MLTHSKKTIKLMLAGSLLLSALSTSAQILTSGFYPNKGQLTIAPSFNYKRSNSFFEGTALAPGNPGGAGDLRANIVNLYAEYGITDKLSVDLSVPYIAIEAANGALTLDEEDQFEGAYASGVQDLNLFAKYKLYENHSDAGCIKIGAAAGVGFPLSDYEPRGVVSIGNKAKTVNIDGIFQYEFPFNLFVEAQGGYSYKDSDGLDVPNAFAYGFKIGYFSEHFYLHTEIDIQDSIDGLDIGGPGFRGPGDLPNTEVDYTLLNFTLYVPVYKDIIGLSTGYSNVIAGRNANKETTISVGLVYKN